LTIQDKYLRSIAEFRNLQAQTRRDVAATQAYTLQRFSSDLLETIDTLTAALESSPPQPPLETADPNQREDVLVTEHRNLYEGLRMIEKILLRTLERHGLTSIPTEGEALPGIHEIVKEVESEKKDVGTITNVIKKGYMLNGKVIRPAKVTISQFPKLILGFHCRRRTIDFFSPSLQKAYSLLSIKSM
jgi:molecular chaperone GrpE